MTDSRIVNGHALAAVGTVTGRTIYRFTSHGDVYLLTPARLATYLLNRPADGYAGTFDTVEEAVTYAQGIAEHERFATNRTRTVGHIAR